MPVRLCAWLSVCLAVSLSLSARVCLSVCVCPCLSVSVSVSLTGVELAFFGFCQDAYREYVELMDTGDDNRVRKRRGQRVVGEGVGVHL